MTYNVSGRTLKLALTILVDTLVPGIRANLAVNSLIMYSATQLITVPRSRTGLQLLLTSNYNSHSASASHRQTAADLELMKVGLMFFKSTLEYNNNKVCFTTANQ